jgi:hypothetical protein
MIKEGSWLNQFAALCKAGAGCFYLGREDVKV